MNEDIKNKQLETPINENSNRGTLLPNEQALELMRKYFVQSAKVQGRIGRLFQVHDFEVRGTDKYYTYDEPVDVAYHIDPLPSRKILNRYGWFTEDTESLPIIMYLTYYDINNKPVILQEGVRVEISAKASILPNDITTRLFQITELKTDFEMNQCVCKVVPVRLDQTENVKVLADKKDPGLENKYFNREIYYEDPIEEPISESEETVEDDEPENTFIKRG